MGSLLQAHNTTYFCTRFLAWLQTHFLAFHPKQNIRLRTSLLLHYTTWYPPILLCLTTRDGVSFLEINHACSTTCRYWPTSDSTYRKVDKNWRPKPPSPSLVIILISRNPSIWYHMHMNMTWWAPVFMLISKLCSIDLASRQQYNNGASSATSAVCGIWCSTCKDWY